jgi:hypothetical protein
VFTPHTNIGVSSFEGGTGSDVGLGLLLGEEQTRRLYNVLGAYLVPFQVCGVLLGGYADRLAVYDQQALLRVEIHRTVEAAVHRVILQHVSHVIHGNQVVDAHHFDVVVRASGTEHQTADTTEAVDTDFNSCHNDLNYLLIKDSVIFFTAQKYILYTFYANKKLNFFTNRLHLFSAPPSRPIPRPFWPA